MTIQWGSYEDGTSPFSAGIRVGIQIESLSSVVHASTTFVVTFSVWTQNHGNYEDTQTVNLDTNLGSLSDDSYDYSNNDQGTTATKRGSNQTVTYTYSTYGSSPGTIALAADISGVANGPTPSKTVNIAIPARPYAVPTAPSSVTATRVSDSQQTIGWTNHSSAAALYQAVKIYRKTDGGSEALIATLSGSATTYSDTTTVANHKYTYSVSASNSAGESAHTAAAAAVWTTPGTPTGCTATKLANGDIRVDWTNNVNYSEYSTVVEHSTNGGSSWSDLDTVAGGTATYTHVSPGTSDTHTYRVRAVSTTGSLNSGHSTASATIALLATASAPTGLAPTGIAQDATGDIILTWVHNPTDSTPQSKRHVQAKVNAGSYADLVNDSSATSSYTVAGGTWTNGDTITWKVATAGQNGTLSTFSAESTFTLADAPTATISAPTATYDLSELTVAWTYFQTQDSAQATWIAKLFDADDNLLEQLTGTDEVEATFTTSLQDGASYTVTVSVTAANGLTSDIDTAAFDVSFLPPAAVTVAAAYDTDSGTMQLTITADDPVEDVTEPVASVDVQRSIDGGDWVTIATGIELSDVAGVQTAIILDTLPTIAGTNTYRAIAYSDLPSSATSDEEEAEVAADKWSFLSAGPSDGFGGLVVRMAAAPQWEPTSGRAKAVYQFAGRSKPVELSGEAITKTLGVSAVLIADSSTERELEAIAVTSSIVCWRDATGRRLFCSLAPVKTSRTNLRSAGVSFDLTEVDFTEGVA